MRAQYNPQGKLVATPAAPKPRAQSTSRARAAAPAPPGGRPPAAASKATPRARGTTGQPQVYRTTPERNRARNARPRANARRVAEAGGRGVGTVKAGISQGGQHAVAAEFMLFVAIVGIRAVATYGPDPVVNGKTQGKSLPADQYGPLFVLGNGIVIYFLLSLVAARGGTAARLAAIGGLIVDLALLLKSIPHIQQLALVYDGPRKYTPAKLTAFTPQEAPASALSPAQISSLSQPGGKLSGPSGAPTAAGASASKAMSYAHSQLTRHGLAVAQFPGLVWLWNKESGWRTNATNPGTGATGIPQLNPNDHTVPPNWSSYQVQVDWGLAYIKATYGSIASAVAHEQHFGWY